MNKITYKVSETVFSSFLTDCEDEKQILLYMEHSKNKNSEEVTITEISDSAAQSLINRGMSVVDIEEELREIAVEVEKGKDMKRFYNDCLTIEEAENIASWILEEATKTECYLEAVQSECGEAVVPFDWEEIENTFGRLFDSERIDVLDHLDRMGNVYIIENGGCEPDFDVHIEF